MRHILLAILALLLIPSTGWAICVCFPCDDCNLLNAGQMNFVVMDREAGTVDLVPNIRIIGNADDFALVVPTPSVPTITEAPVTIWDEALALTAPVWLNSTSSGRTGCGGSDVLGTVVPTDENTRDDDGVDIIAHQKVGAFLATTIQSDDPRQLVQWLLDNNFSISGLSPELLRPLVEADWVFTAMKLDTDKVTAPDRWDANVDPVRFTYDARSLDVPLPLFTVNRAGQLPMAFFIVDDIKTTFPGFTTTYANRIDDEEFAAIAETYPTVAEFVAPGRFLTRLDHTFVEDRELEEPIRLTQAEDDREFRRTRSFGFSAVPVWMLVAGGGILLMRRRNRGRG